MPAAEAVGISPCMKALRAEFGLPDERFGSNPFGARCDEIAKKAAHKYHNGYALK
jgi:hypothetical protein